jgi:hypothetical protein
MLMEYPGTMGTSGNAAKLPSRLILGTVSFGLQTFPGEHPSNLVNRLECLKWGVQEVKFSKQASLLGYCPD